MTRFLFILAASLCLTACGDRVASPGDTAPASSAVVDSAIVKATRALVLAELAYEPVATAALKLIETGQVKGATAGTIRDLNRTTRDAFKAAKAAHSAATMEEQLAIAKSASSSLSAIVKAFE